MFCFFVQISNSLTGRKSNVIYKNVRTDSNYLANKDSSLPSAKCRTMCGIPVSSPLCPMTQTLTQVKVKRGGWDMARHVTPWSVVFAGGLSRCEQSCNDGPGKGCRRRSEEPPRLCRCLLRYGHRQLQCR